MSNRTRSEFKRRAEARGERTPENIGDRWTFDSSQPLMGEPLDNEDVVEVDSMIPPQRR